MILYFVFRNSCVLNVSNESNKKPASFAAPLVPDLSFWPTRTRKNFDFFEMRACLDPGA